MERQELLGSLPSAASDACVTLRLGPHLESTHPSRRCSLGPAQPLEDGSALQGLSTVIIQRQLPGAALTALYQTLLCEQKCSGVRTRVGDINAPTHMGKHTHLIVSLKFGKTQGSGWSIDLFRKLIVPLQVGLRRVQFSQCLQSGQHQVPLHSTQLLIQSPAQVAGAKADYQSPAEVIIRRFPTRQGSSQHTSIYSQRWVRAFRLQTSEI